MVVKTWCDMKFDRRDYVLENDIVWLNSNFSKILYNKDCLEQGLLLANQFYNGNQVIGLEEICNKYNVKLNIIYNQVIVQNIITMYGKTINNDSVCTERDSIVKTVFEKPKDTYLSKKIYRFLIKRKEHCEEVRDKWQHVQIEYDNNTLFSHIERCTIVNKLRSFQFKLLHRILYFNNRLFKCKLSCSSLCDFCSEDIDSIEHRFLFCRVTQGFYQDMDRWIKDRFRINYNFQSPHCIITNICKDMPLLETLLLNAKYYIYTCFIQKVIPNITVFKCKVEDLEKIERHIAEEKNSLFIHNMKWNTP